MEIEPISYSVARSALRLHSELSYKQRARDHRKAFEEKGNIDRTHDRARIGNHRRTVNDDGYRDEKDNYEPSS
jgi:hypothetical protein